MVCGVVAKRFLNPARLFSALNIGMAKSGYNGEHITRCLRGGGTRPAMAA